MDFNLLCLILNSLDVFGTDSVRYGAEPLLDGAQFGSAKGRVAEEEQVSDEAPRRESRDIYSILYIYLYRFKMCEAFSGAETLLQALYQGMVQMQRKGLPEIHQRLDLRS